MENSYTKREDGTIDLKPDFKLTSGFLKLWKQDPQDCRHFIPNFPECNHRKIESQKLSCGKISLTWTCTKHCFGVSVQLCNECVKQKRNK